jgi:hypothetical protein
MLPDIWIVRTHVRPEPKSDQVFADDIIAVFTNEADAGDYVHELSLIDPGVPAGWIITGHNFDTPKRVVDKPG